MSDLKKYYEYLNILQPFEYAEGMIDRVTGQVPVVRKDESLLEIVVVDAGLFKSFDPLSPYQAPFVEILIEGPEGRQLIETSTCHPQSEEPTYEEEEECSFRPTWNERFIFRAAGAMYVRFDLCIEHVVRNRTICGFCGFSAEDLWSRAKDGRQILTVPLIHNKGGGWEIEEELVGALRIIVGLLDIATVEKLPKLDKHLLQMNPEHAHHFGYKGGQKQTKEVKKQKKKEEQDFRERLVMPSLQYVQQQIPLTTSSIPLEPQRTLQPVQYEVARPQPVYGEVSAPFASTMMPSPGPYPTESMTRMPTPPTRLPTPPSQRSRQSTPMMTPQGPGPVMTTSRPTFDVPSPIPVTSVPNLVPASLAPISSAPVF